MDTIMTLRFEQPRMISSMPFDQYLAEPHFSNSKMGTLERGYDLQPTAKMTLGKEVDMILANGHPGTGLSLRAIRIAKKIESAHCWMVVKDSIKQPSIFGTFVLHVDEAGKQVPVFTAPFKTRPDFLCRKCTVDLKVTEVRIKNIPELITAMKYERQMWIHRTMAQVPDSYLMIHSIPDGKTILHKVESDLTDDIMNFVMLNGSGI